MSADLRVERLDHRYGNAKILSGLSFVASAGRVYTLIGPNGSGKSTLLKVLAGLLISGREGSTITGEFFVGDQPVRKKSAREWARLVHYCGPDLRTDFLISVLDTVAMGRQPYSVDSFGRRSSADIDQATSALDQLKISHLAERSVSRLSAGERQLVAIARALALDPQVLLLDESLSQMDLHFQAHVGRLIESWAALHSRVVMLVSHDLNVATEWATHALLLSDLGQLLGFGMIEQALSESNLRKLYPSLKFKLAPSPVSQKPKVFFDHA